MKYVITSVKDTLRGFTSFTLEQNEKAAIRNFKDAVNKSEMISLHLPDYSLYKLGVFETDTGVIDNSGCPELLINASDSIVE